MLIKVSYTSNHTFPVKFSAYQPGALTSLQNYEFNRISIAYFQNYITEDAFTVSFISSFSDEIVYKNVPVK